MDSLANGGGPWVNKLLLNAIYFSGAIYSDRPCLRTDGDPSSVGARYYTRFRHLLVDEIDKPSIPTAVALLLASATLVSQGRSSAGWNLSGTAYRMIIDMGCHLALSPDYQSKSAQDYGQTLRRDLEQEMRKRLYWSAFITDATQSLYLGRPTMLASVEARVPLSPAVPPPPYVSQPAHAESTFTYLVRLFQISVRITELYGIQAMRFTSEELQDRRDAASKELDHWSMTLPEHLRFDPEGPIVPPPHQITPHTTCHALRILLHRAFLEEGHLRRHCDEAGRRHSEEACIASALAIGKLVRVYRKAFTLRRAPFLLSYAIYSAVIVILRQERHDRGQFTELISFFWTCLSELQHGCNSGLAKPLSVLRDMVHEFQLSVQRGVQGIDHLTRLDETFFPPDVSQHFGDSAVEQNPPVDASWLQDQFSPMESLEQTLDASSPGFLASLNQLNNDITQDTLYGLFAPPHAFP
ncbi:hypothetical protein N7468_010277 [Penicillium chermesinum]|uniref:Xylanolytic transcriptional activator regulatory domain-containing protein n=1 Tax=Penicillium chermesinum TaxID=63820 RepID=A0A9W9NE68_9EURO|nr:uncharacterized protein N7468_010277 [Penicillium chermesinum]KAJ5217269.1 hypothetical protein N7468_010277 [Penicillium chermesinum]